MVGVVQNTKSTLSGSIKKRWRTPATVFLTSCPFSYLILSPCPVIKVMIA